MGAQFGVGEDAAVSDGLYCLDAGRVRCATLAKFYGGRASLFRAVIGFHINYYDLGACELGSAWFRNARAEFDDADVAALICYEGDCICASEYDNGSYFDDRALHDVWDGYGYVAAVVFRFEDYVVFRRFRHENDRGVAVTVGIFYRDEACCDNRAVVCNGVAVISSGVAHLVFVCVVVTGDIGRYVRLSDVVAVGSSSIGDAVSDGYAIGGFAIRAYVSYAAAAWYHAVAVRYAVYRRG